MSAGTVPMDSTRSGQTLVAGAQGGQAVSPQTSVMEKFREKMGLGMLSIAGFALTITLAIFLVWKGWTDASAITSVVGPFTTLLGTLVGAFFGVQVGAQGKENVEKEVEKEQQKVATAEQKVEKARLQVQSLQSVASPELIREAWGVNPEAWK